MAALQPVVSVCYNYSTDSLVDSRVTIVVSPIRLAGPQDKLYVSWACSRARTCRTVGCVYPPSHNIRREDGSNISES